MNENVLILKQVNKMHLKSIHQAVMMCLVLQVCEEGELFKET